MYDPYASGPGPAQQLLRLRRAVSGTIPVLMRRQSRTPACLACARPHPTLAQTLSRQVLMQLRSLGHSASCLFRGKVPSSERSPRTAHLLRAIGSQQSSAALLSAAPLPPPPAVYEYTDLYALAAFARNGWFDAVLCSLWFWRDPMPSSAELLLPTLALHAPRHRRPFVAILSDDAHSSKVSTRRL